MELLPEADNVLRQYMPPLVAAAGLEEVGERLLSVGPIDDGRALAAAARVLRRARETEAPRVFGPWREAVDAALFWAEASLWAALRGDYACFMEHVERMRAAMEDVPAPGLH